MSNSNKIFVGAGVALAADQAQALRVRAGPSLGMRVASIVPRTMELLPDGLRETICNGSAPVEAPNQVRAQAEEMVQQAVGTVSAKASGVDVYNKITQVMEGIIEADGNAETYILEEKILSPETAEAEGEDKLEETIFSPETAEAEGEENLTKFINKVEEKFDSLTKFINTLSGAHKSVELAVTEATTEARRVASIVVDEHTNYILDVLAKLEGLVGDAIRVTDEHLLIAQTAAFLELYPDLGDSDTFAEIVAARLNKMEPEEIEQTRRLAEVYTYIYSETKGDGVAANVEKAFKVQLANNLERKTIRETEEEQVSIGTQAAWFYTSLAYGLVMTPLDKVVYQLQAQEMAKERGLRGQFKYNLQQGGVSSLPQGAHLNGLTKIISNSLPRMVSALVMDQLKDCDKLPDLVTTTLAPGIISGISQAIFAQLPNFMKVQTFSGAERGPVRALFFGGTPFSMYAQGFGAQVGMNVVGNTVNQFGQQFSKRLRGADSYAKLEAVDEITGSIMSVYASTIFSLTRTLQQTEAAQATLARRDIKPVTFSDVGKYLAGELQDAFLQDAKAPRAMYKRVVDVFIKFETTTRVSPVVVRMAVQTLCLSKFVEAVEKWSTVNITA